MPCYGWYPWEASSFLRKARGKVDLGEREGMGRSGKSGRRGNCCQDERKRKTEKSDTQYPFWILLLQPSLHDLFPLSYYFLARGMIYHSLLQMTGTKFWLQYFYSVSVPVGGLQFSVDRIKYYFPCILLCLSTVFTSFASLHFPFPALHTVLQVLLIYGISCLFICLVCLRKPSSVSGSSTNWHAHF